MRNWIIVLTAALLTFGLSMRVNSNVDAEKIFKEFPVMKVNVYMMGRQVAEPEVTTMIFENIEYLNEVFEGQISFVFDELFMDPNHAYLPDIYKSYQTDAKEIIGPIVAPIEKKGGINIFLFDTYCEIGQNAALMGFTPLLRAKQNTYASNSPRFDRILMSYDGLLENKTMVHEMGHFFGLKHPWEMTASDKYRLGLRSEKDECSNHMSYCSGVEKFTRPQLEDMRNYAMKYRTYLMEKVVRVYAGV